MKRQAYLRWFRRTMAGQPCQCLNLACRRPGDQVHHEPGGIGKDDRSIVWLSAVCHENRTREREMVVPVHRHSAAAPWTTVRYTPRQVRDALRATAFDNFLHYLDATEASGEPADGSGDAIF